MRTTIKQIAAALGVSAKTVSKALNNRGEVSEEQRQRIIETAKMMDYRPNRSAAALSRREIRLISIAPLEPVNYYSFVNAGLTSAARELEDLNCTVDFRWYSSPNAHDEVHKLLREVISSNTNASGLVIACSYEPKFYYEELKDISRKMPVVFNTLFANGIDHIGAVGLKTHMAGKMAAEYLMSVTKESGDKLALLTGNRDAPVHKGCIEGFIEKAGSIGALFDTYDDFDEAERYTIELFSKNRDIRGIYVSSYNSPGVCRGLRKLGLGGKIPVIGHDIYPEIIDCLNDGTLTGTLFQDQMMYGRNSLRCLYEYSVGISESRYGLMTPRIVLGCMAHEFPEYEKIVLCKPYFSETNNTEVIT